MLRRAGTIRLFFAALVFLLFMSVYHIVTVQGEQSEPKFVLLRLEDIGPGGQYDSTEQLGKLRAVFEYLAAQRIPYQIGVVCRWYNVREDKSVYDKTIADSSDPYVVAFDALLRYAESHGGVIGMHGYTHQVGFEFRKDGNQESGIGNEFNVAEAPETASVAFAEQRINAGLSLFRQAGLKPQFWETPHYHLSPQQADVFRAHFGLLYESVPENPKQPAAVYVNKPNKGYGQPTHGSVHVPTPYSFIPYNRDERLILDQLDRNKRLPSFFYHPFLEFKHLTPVTDGSGQPVIRDGLPEYRYPVKDKTILQKLAGGLRERGYKFYSVHDYVPFTPAQTVKLEAPKEAKTRIGDVTGDGQEDFVAWNERSGEIVVRAGQFRGMRNEQQPDPVVWLQLKKQKGDLFALLDDNGDGRNDLWVVRAAGQVEAYHSTGTGFVFYRSWNVGQLGDWGELYPLRQANGDWVLAGSSKDYSQLLAVYIHNGEPKAVPPLKWRSNAVKNVQISRGANGESDYFRLYNEDTGTLLQLSFQPSALKWRVHKMTLELPLGGGELKIADFNGDGLEDALLWNGNEMTGTVYLKGEDGNYVALPRFGPWGRPGGRLVAYDFDGNGKCDIGMLNPAEGTVDVALSFESAVGSR